MQKIRERTEAKELRMASGLVMTKEQWLARGATYRGSLGTAARGGYYTPRVCEKMGQAVSEEEMSACQDFAMFKTCYTEHCIIVDGKSRKPCLPVFFREEN